MNLRHGIIGIQTKMGFKPVCSRLYLVLKSHKEIIEKYFCCVYKLGILKKSNKYTQPNPKSGRVHLLSKFTGFNSHIKHKLYSMPKIQ